MAQQAKEQKRPEKDEINELRAKMVQRLAVAGVLVAALLGVLAVFDHLSNPPEESEVQVFTKPVPVAPRKEVTQPVTPATLPEPPAEAVGSPTPAEAPPKPVVEASPRVAAPTAVMETPSIPRPPVRPEMAPSRPSTAGIVRPLPPQPPVAPAAPVERKAAPAAIPEGTMPPPIAPAAPAEARPSARVAETRPAPVTPPTVQRLFSGFVLQAGVFANPNLAEELHARLALAGVPTTVETRVQVGPFRTRQEALQAQVKLREQGIETVLVPPKGGRN